jgi:ankyrin repeat protein
VVRLLREKGASITAVDCKGQCALHLLARFARPWQLDLFNLFPLDVLYADRNGVTPLHIACNRLWPELIEYLCHCGQIDAVKAQDNDGLTPLHYAIKRVPTQNERSWGMDGKIREERTNVVKQLVKKHGASVLIKDKQGRDAEAFARALNIADDLTFLQKYKGIQANALGVDAKDAVPGMVVETDEPPAENMDTMKI